MHNYTGKGKGWSQFIQWVIDGEGAIRFPSTDGDQIEGEVRFPDGERGAFSLFKSVRRTPRLPLRGDHVIVILSSGNVLEFGGETIFPATF